MHVSPAAVPHAAARSPARDMHRRSEVPFVEVHVATPIDVCAQRRAR
jgi:adenylylsulfate kinase